MPMQRIMVPTAFWMISSFSLIRQFADGYSVRDRLLFHDEPEAGVEGGAALPHVLRFRELAEDRARLVGEVLADDGPGGEVDQVPVVDAVVAAEIEVEEFLAARLGRLLSAWPAGP